MKGQTAERKTYSRGRENNRNHDIGSLLNRRILAVAAALTGNLSAAGPFGKTGF